MGYELHQNRTKAELSNWRAPLQTLVDYKGLTHDPEFAAFIARAQTDYEAVSDADRMRFGLYMEQGVHIIGSFLKHNNSLPGKLKGPRTQSRTCSWTC